jgi:hypothetical protein
MKYTGDESKATIVTAIVSAILIAVSVIGLFFIKVCENSQKQDVEIIEPEPQQEPIPSTNVNIGETWVFYDDETDPFKNKGVEMEAIVNDIKGDYVQIRMTDNPDIMISFETKQLVRSWVKTKGVE